MKYIVEPVTILQTNQFIKSRKITDILVGTSFTTYGDCLKLSVEQLNNMIEIQKDIKLSLKVNRIFHEDELNDLIIELKKINLDKIKYIFYSDLGVLDILEELGLTSKAIYEGYTYTTNINDINELSKYNRGIVISNQISVDELLDIVNKQTKSIVYGFGKSIVFYSKRPLISNYFKYRNFDENPYLNNYYLKEEFRDDKYHIFEDENGSYVYETFHYCLFDEIINNNNIEYIILNSATLKASKYNEVVKAYLNKNIDYINNANIPYYKGIYESKSVLLKEEVQ